MACKNCYPFLRGSTGKEWALFVMRDLPCLRGGGSRLGFLLFELQDKPPSTNVNRRQRSGTIRFCDAAIGARGIRSGLFRDVSWERSDGLFALQQAHLDG